jgi:O-antigen/teichoic acid export membrane protein
MGIIQRQGIQSTIITYAGIFIGCISLLWVQPNFLTAEEVGLTRVLFSFSFLVSTVLPLSAGNVIARYFPRFRDAASKHHGFLGFILIFPLIGILICFPILLLLKPLIVGLYIEESPLFANYFALVFPLSLVLTLLAIINNYLYSIFRPLLPALGQEVIIRLLFIFLIFWYTSGQISLETFIYSFVGTYLVQFLLVIYQLIKVGNISLRPDKSILTTIFLKEIGKYAGMVFLAGIASMAIKLMDVIVLGQFVPLALVGVYGVAAFIPIFIEAPINALDKVANAQIAHSWEKNDLKNIQDIYYKSARYLFLLGGLLFLLITLNAPYVLKWLPSEYYQGLPVISILSLSALFNLMTGSNSSIIFTSEKFTVGSIALVSVAIIDLILLYAFIPIWGIEGAAWATCAASFLYNGFKWLYIKVKFNLQPFDLRTLYITAAIVATYGVTSFLPLWGNVWIDATLHTMLSSFLYFVLIWYSRAAEDLIPVLKQLTRKSNS